MSRPTFLLLAVVAVAFAYAPVAGSEFVADDYPDLAYIAHASVLDLLRDGLWGVEGGAGRYRPVLHLSAKLDWWLWGLNPFGYHLTHFVLHASAGFLFFSILTRIASPFVAVAAALLWLVHPLHPEAVSWFAARGNLLAVLFLCLAILLVVQLRQGATRFRRWRLAAAWSAALAAHLSHELVILLPLLLGVLDFFVLTKGGDLATRLRRALQSFAFFGSALALCLLLRVWIVEAAFGGELIEVLGLVPESARVGLLLTSMGERARLLLAPVHPALLPAAASWGILVLTLVAVLAGVVGCRPRTVLAAMLPVAVSFILLYLPAAFVIIDAASFVNTRMFYALVLPWVVLVALSFSRWPSPWRWSLVAVFVLGNAALTHGHNRERARASAEAAAWAHAVRKTAARDPAAPSFHLLDPPLAHGGILVLENAIGSFLRPPFSDENRECHFVTTEMLTGLAVLPEGAEFRRRRPRFLWREAGGEFRTGTLPETRVLATRTFRGNDLPATRLTTPDVAGIRAKGTGLLVLEWSSAEGRRGEVVGWPLPAAAGGGVLFPVASDAAWLLAGTVVALHIRGGDAGEVTILDALPGVPVESPRDEQVVVRGATPPTFAGTAAGIGPVARLRFLTWPGPLSLSVPLAGPRLELEPALTPDTSGRFAWKVFEDAFLFVPGLQRMYWCFEEVDALGRVVARSELRRLVPGR